MNRAFELTRTKHQRWLIASADSDCQQIYFDVIIAASAVRAIEFVERVRPWATHDTDFKTMVF